MGSDLTEFLTQPFISGIIGIMCFFVVLLVVVVVLLMYFRQRRAMESAPVITSMPPPTYANDTGELPDLDLLVQPAGQAAPPTTPGGLPPAPPAPRLSRKGTAVVAVNDGDATEAVEVMSILRDVMNGTLIVQMGDKAYQNLNTDPEFKERFNKLMRELGQVTTANRPAPPPPAEEAYTETPAEAEEMPPAPAPPPPAPRPASSPMPRPTSGPLPGDLPSFKLEDNPMPEKKRGQKLHLKPVPEVNIAGAIEAYLQHKLRHTPEFAGRSIHIYPAPDGGVSIEVDGQYYNAVGDIGDGEVREFIATAIQEWQERH